MSTSASLPAAIVGMGNWGQVLVNAVQGRSEHIRFVAGTTRTPDRARDFAARHNIEILPDLEALLARGDIHAVVLATPHSQHLSQIEAAVVAGKHVFCEKPLTLTAADAERAYAAAQAAGLVLAVGHNRRFLPAYQHLSRLVAEEIGDLRQIIGNFSSGPPNYRPGSWRNLDSESPAGGMTGLGIHVVDAMVGLGIHPQRVTVATGRRTTEGRADTVTALVDNADGSLAVLTTIQGPGRFWRIEAFGSRGWAAMDGEYRVAFGRPGEPEQLWHFNWSDVERAELEAFAVAVAGGASYVVDADQAIRGVALFEAICRAAAAAPYGQGEADVVQR